MRAINPRRVRALREQRGWSQQHLADAAGVDLRTVQRSEAGNAGPEAKKALAAAFDTEVESLLLPMITVNSSALTDDASAIACYLLEHDETGMAWGTEFDSSEVATALGLGDDELAVALDELENSGVIKRIASFSSDTISPADPLFALGDSQVRTWDPQSDAGDMAATALNEPHDQASVVRLDEVLSWGPRRINAAAHLLVMSGTVDTLGGCGTWPYAYGTLHVTAKTRQYLRKLGRL